jgi:hypothetical protein
MEFKCVNKDCECFDEVVHYYTVNFKWDASGKCIPDKDCVLCKQPLESIPDKTPIGEKNIWAATEIGSPSKQWTKHGKKSIY